MARRARKTNIKELPPKVYLFSEDEVTAPLYLRALFGSKRTVKLEVMKVGAVPKTLFKGAKRQQSKLPEKRDKVWLIFDRDEHPKVDEVVNDCKGSDIVLGYSNPCFELWLLYHYQDHHAPDARDTLKKKLTGICEGYCGRRQKLNDASELMGLIENAVTRADDSIVRRIAEGDPNGRPSSTMADIIRDFKNFD